MAIHPDRVRSAGAAALVVGSILASVLMAVPGCSSPPADLLPDEIHGYVSREEGVYTADNLFDLLDGGAEVYLSFNVQVVVNRRYGKPDAPDILVDVFDMGSPAGAYGAFHHDMREGEEADVGQESERMGSVLSFWKDRFFVSILALRETPETERAVLALGQAIAGNIPREGAMPEVVRWLPREGLQASQITYFHDWTYLNTRYFLAQENLLGIDDGTEGVLARYRRGREGTEGSSFLLLLIRYPSADRSRRGLARFADDYLPGADADGVVRRQDGKWAAARTVDEVVMVVLEADARPDIDQLVTRVEEARGR